MQKKIGIFFFISLLLCLPGWTEEVLIVHEWGTFTAMQDESGNAVAGINTDDEPVPSFVYRLEKIHLIHRLDDRPTHWFQGAPACHRDVTMRLETPVVYFYPPKSKKFKNEFDVSVQFKGGWITEYFPQGETEAPEFPSSLKTTTVGKLTWKSVQTGDFKSSQETNEHVWITPRNVKAKSISLPNGEAEKYLFYRGVGHLDSLVKVTRDAGDQSLSLAGKWNKDIPLTIEYLWLVDIQKDGTAAFKTLGPVTFHEEQQEIKLPSHFKTEDFSQKNLKLLRDSMHSALVKLGLYEDEATAMLDTWELSYFKSHGLRLFYVVPTEWVNETLPFKISVPSQITRVMLGRIEIVTPKQREILTRIAQGPLPDLEPLTKAYYDQFPRNTPERNEHLFTMSLSELSSELGVEIPETYQAYLDLGRFRDALVLDEQSKRPSENLKGFIEKNRIRFW